MNLTLEWRDRRVGPMQTPRRFLDFVVDGESLYERQRIDRISPLGWLDPEQEEHVAARLLRDEPGDIEGRVAIYVCAECGDIGCGALTALIGYDAATDEIVWRDIAESYWDEAWIHERETSVAWDELRFPVNEYRDAILNRPQAEQALSR